MRNCLASISFGSRRAARTRSGHGRYVPVADPVEKPGALQALAAERDAALSVLERRERELEEQLRLLTEEQDRFVSRLLEAHEREVGKLRLELDEANTTAVRLEQKQERERVATLRLEEDLAHAQADVERLRSERDVARAETRRAQQAYVSTQATVERLQAELTFAKSMLADAMGEERLESVQPAPRAHDASRPPRESVIVNRRIPRPRSTPPGTRRTDAPRANAVNATPEPPETVPPSSR
jgi:hypothetical protein